MPRRQEKGEEEPHFCPRFSTWTHHKPSKTGAAVMTLRLRHRNSKVDSRILRYILSHHFPNESVLWRPRFYFYTSRSFSEKRETFPRGLLPLEIWQNIDIVLCIIEMFLIHTLQECQLSYKYSFSINSKKKIFSIFF